VHREIDRGADQPGHLSARGAEPVLGTPPGNLGWDAHPAQDLQLGRFSMIREGPSMKSRGPSSGERWR
jgi:hypothetical protein